MSNCLREAGAGSSHRGVKRRQTHAVRAAGPSGEAASPSSHPDQIFFIELASCCLFGRYHELTISPLPEFCLTSINGNLPARKSPNPCNPCLPECSVHEHCLGSAVVELMSAFPESGRSNCSKNAVFRFRFRPKSRRSTWSFGRSTVFRRHGLPVFQQVHFLQ